MKRFIRGLLAIALPLAFAAPALAQGGGASTTGTIQGRVTDNSDAILPGVTVTISSPALIGGPQSQVTNEQGNYRFPAVPPGAYAVEFELTGFNRLRREGIQVTLGFTANVNGELAVASLQETVTVTGESPIIDTSSTRVQQNFKLEELNSLPNARDMWSLLAVTPGVSMGRIDVGGNRAGTQTDYQAYGYGAQDQQVRVLVEGINTTEGTGGAGFYFDYGSFEEVFMGTAGNGAEMPHPGVQSQFLGKSGGNQFSGGVYIDWYNDSLQGSNISDAQLARGIRPGSNAMLNYYDFNINLGGAIKQDKLWWYFSYRDQENQVSQPNFQFAQTFDTRLWNPTGKGTYLIHQNHKLIGFYQWGQKIQPYRQFSSAYTYSDPSQLRRQDSGSWVYKGEWNGTISPKLYVEARYGEFGYYFPLAGYSSDPWRQDDGARTVTGGDWRWQQDRQRKQATGAATYFIDNLLGGSHNVRFGAEMNLETQWNGISSYRPGGIQHIFSNNQALRVTLGFPTASCEVGSLSARDCLLSIAKLDHSNAFLSDTWALGRVTLTLGVRYDHYKSHVPDQVQLANTIAGLPVPARDFPAQTFFTWDSVVPRVGFTYDLRGDGRSVVKLNYGFFKHNPGPGIAASGNPNQNQKTITYNWTDTNGNRLFDFGEQGSVVSDFTGPGGVRIDPNIKQPYTHEVSTFFEQQLTETTGVRLGYVYKTNDDLWQQYQPFRGPDAYTATFNYTDIGPDGISGTGDDQIIPLRAIPTAQLGPATTIVMTVPALGRYHSVDLSGQKRLSNRWSAGGGFGYTWSEEHENDYRNNDVSSANNPGFPNSGNDPGAHDFNGWGFRMYGAYEGPFGIRFSPIFRHQAGQQYGRTISVTGVPAGLFASTAGAALIEPLNSRRMDNINVFDVRVEKSIPLVGRSRIRAFADFFNIGNSNAAETISFQTGTGFERPTNILAPRTVRIGARFEW
ncbi:MAG: carboxypeptidase regulatory-like domain-containing protein [Vicinamibacterales bacterium]